MSLSNKQRVFIEEYLKDFNATQAAIRAGYSEKTAYNIGWENVRKREIAEAIEKRLQENAMSANEVLSRLAEQARSNIAEFATINSGQELKRHPQAYLVKKFKRKVYNPPNSEPYEDLELELYDAHAALVDIGKKHGLFSDNLNVKLEGELDKVLDELEQNLEPELFQRILKIIAG